MSLATPLEMETVVCPCGGGGRPSEVFHTSTRRYVGCPRCGLVFLNPRPSSTRGEEYYRESYDGSYGAAESSADRQPVFASVSRGSRASESEGLYGHFAGRTWPIDRRPVRCGDPGECLGSGHGSCGDRQSHDATDKTSRDYCNTGIKWTVSSANENACSLVRIPA